VSVSCVRAGHRYYFRNSGFAMVFISLCLPLSKSSSKLGPRDRSGNTPSFMSRNDIERIGCGIRYGSEVYATLTFICTGSGGVGGSAEDRFVPGAETVRVRSLFGLLSETRTEEQKSVKDRYILVAAIDIVSSEGIRNMTFSASFRYRHWRELGSGPNQEPNKTLFPQ